MRICNKGYCASVGDDYVGMFTDGGHCPACASIRIKAKEWFATHGIDSDLIISSGVAAEHNIIQMYRKEVLKEPV